MYSHSSRYNFALVFSWIGHYKLMITKPTEIQGIKGRLGTLLERMSIVSDVYLIWGYLMSAFKFCMWINYYLLWSLSSVHSKKYFKHSWKRIYLLVMKSRISTTLLPTSFTILPTNSKLNTYASCSIRSGFLLLYPKLNKYFLTLATNVPSTYMVIIWMALWQTCIQHKTYYQQDSISAKS